VEFKGTKSWLKSFDSNKVIAKAIKKGRLYKLVGVVQSLVAEYSIKIKESDLRYQKFKHVSM